MAEWVGEAGRLEKTAECVSNLPMEIITWTVQEQDKTLSVTDSRRCVVSHCDLVDPTTADLRALLIGCFTRPLFGQPRRPRRLRCRKKFREMFAGLAAELAGYGIECRVGAVTSGRHAWPADTLIRACSVCGRRGSPQLFITCAACSAVCYCSDVCRSADYDHSQDAHGHRDWCTKMAAYMQQSAALADLPFTFISETTSPDFDSAKLKRFLNGFSMCSDGCWKSQFPREDDPDMGPDNAPFDAGRRDRSSPPGGAVPPPLEGAAPPPPPAALRGWAEYYAWRGVDLGSPLCALLQFPLTVYHLVCPLLAASPQTSDGANDDFEIHLLGAEQETEMIDIFMELGALLPDTRFNIHMIGPHILAAADGKVVVKDKVKVTLYRSVYHKLRIGKPHVAIGLNAGLSAYSTWPETLQKLKDDRTVAYFTDYCRYSCRCSRDAVEGSKVGTTSAVTLNPFRSPLRRYCEEHAMPWYSNAFLFRLEYDSD